MNKMEHMEIKQLVVSMSLPIIISMVIQALYNIVDSIFVAKVSSDALTAVSLCYPVQTIMVAIACGTAVGFNTLLARYLGEKKFDYANNTMMHGILLGFVNGLVFLILGLLFSNVFLSWFTSDSNVLSLANTYIRICTMFSFSVFVQIIFERIMQATGNAIYNMVMQGAGAIINIILDPILIFGWFGLPEMGVAGAALATVISQLAGTALGIYYNLRKNQEIQFSLSTLRPSKPVISRIYGVGIPSILLQTVSSVLIFGLNQILVAFSETATAVYGVFFKLQGFAFLPIIGMNNGMVPIIAYNYGAKKPHRITATIRLAVISALCIMVVAIAIFQIFPAQLLGIFQASPDMLAIGVPALRILSTSFFIGGFTIVASSVFQALGRGLLSMTIAIFRQLVLVLPLAYLFSRSGKLDLVWCAFPVAEVLAGALAGYFLWKAYRKVILPLEEQGYQF